MPIFINLKIYLLYGSFLRVFNNLLIISLKDSLQNSAQLSLKCLLNRFKIGKESITGKHFKRLHLSYSNQIYLYFYKKKAI